MGTISYNVVSKEVVKQLIDAAFTTPEKVFKKKVIFFCTNEGTITRNYIAKVDGKVWHVADNSPKHMVTSYTDFIDIVEKEYSPAPVLDNSVMLARGQKLG